MDRRTKTRAPLTAPQNRQGSSHYFTPARARVRGAVKICDRKGMDYFKEDIFRTFNVTRRQAYQFLEDNTSSGRLHNEPGYEEPRGRKSLISLEKI